MVPSEHILTTGQLRLKANVDVAACRRAVARVVEGLQFAAVDRINLVTAASELARDAIASGGRGMFAWAVVRREDHLGVRLTFLYPVADISDLERAMKDQGTSAGEERIGLSGARGLVHEFSIKTVIGVGTRITATRWK